MSLPLKEMRRRPSRFIVATVVLSFLATLLMNLCVPLIDMKTQPPVFGHKANKDAKP